MRYFQNEFYKKTEMKKMLQSITIQMLALAETVVEVL